MAVSTCSDAMAQRKCRLRGRPNWTLLCRSSVKAREGKMTELSDSELVEDARAGDLNAFGDLIRRHHARVAGMCANLLDNRSEADDAAQEIFIKVHRSLDKFNGDSLFSTWLYRITTNHCIDARRKSGRRRMVSLDAIVDENGESAGGLMKESSPQSEKIEESALAQKLLAELPDIYREALVLRTNGLSYEEISDALQCTLEAVRARLRRARRLLAENMGHSIRSGDVKRPDGAGEAYEA